MLLATASVSVYFAIQKPYLQKYGALPFTAYAVWAGTILLLPFLPALMREAASAPPRATLIAAYLGVSTAVAFATISYVFERLPASQAVTLEYVFPQWPSLSPTSGWGRSRAPWRWRVGPSPCRGWCWSTAAGVDAPNFRESLSLRSSARPQAGGDARRGGRNTCGWYYRILM